MSAPGDTVSSELVTDKLAAWSLVTLDAPGRMGDDTWCDHRPLQTALWEIRTFALLKISSSEAILGHHGQDEKGLRI